MTNFSRRNVLALGGAGLAAAAMPRFGFAQTADSINLAMIAPLTVPVLNNVGGWPLVFGVLAAAFVLAMVSTFFLPERTGEVLEEQ